MVRSELITALARENPGLTAREVGRVVDTFFEVIAETLAEGGRADFRGFGTFSPRERPAREVRNPRTGTYRMAPAQRVVHFNAGREICRRINMLPAAAVEQADASLAVADPSALTSG